MPHNLYDMLINEFPTQKKDKQVAPDNSEVNVVVDKVSNKIGDLVDEIFIFKKFPRKGKKLPKNSPYALFILNKVQSNGILVTIEECLLINSMLKHLSTMKLWSFLVMLSC